MTGRVCLPLFSHIWPGSHGQSCGPHTAPCSAGSGSISHRPGNKKKSIEVLNSN
jgi:hypothetical protein